VVSNYSIPITLPSGTKLRLFELKNRDFLTIVKFCENEDFNGFVGIIQCLIPQFSALNIVDKAYVLIAYRALFVNADTHVTNANEIPIKIPLVTILDKLEQINVSTHTVDCEGFSVCVSPFNNYDYEDCGTIFDSIEHITYSGLTVSGEDIPKVINSLPPRVFSVINREIVAIYETFNKVEIVSANENLELQAMHISLIDSSFGRFIMSLYKVPLRSLFENLFIYSQRMGNIDFFELSPLDSQVLENILQREVSKAKADNDTPQHINPLTPQ
jgi:hypothetical protein